MVSCINSHSKNKPSTFWPILTISEYREIKTENCKNQTAIELLPIWCQVAHFKIAALREGRNRAISKQNTAQAGTFGMNTCTTDAGRPLKMVKDFKKAPSRVLIIYSHVATRSLCLTVLLISNHGLQWFLAQPYTVPVRVAFVLPSKVTSGLQSRRWKPPKAPPCGGWAPTYGSDIKIHSASWCA